MSLQINLPPNTENTNSQQFELEWSLVIIGANGSGKSRFGKWIEDNMGTTVKRISAQRVLQFAPSIPRTIFDQDLSELLSGFRGRPIAQQLDDYPKVLSVLFSETAKRDSEYVKISRTTESKLEVPSSTIDKLITVWDEILPHRELILENNTIRARSRISSQEYAGTEMSDGERVALYLIAQCLLLPTNHLILIDEPELHLHKSLMARLWNAIEKTRNDCSFIYITHDLDFASSRVSARKIWIKSFENNIWDWQFIEEDEFIPENLLLEVIGSRKPILFIEGERGSSDYALYQEYYSDFTVIPRWSCRHVIESVYWLSANSELHSIRAFGLIDRDGRSKDEIENLQKNNVFVLPFSEIENVFLAPELLKCVTEHLWLNFSEKFPEISEKIFSKLTDEEKKRLILHKVISEIKFLQRELLNAKIADLSWVASTIDEVRGDLEGIAKSIEEQIEAAVKNADYLGLLEMYPNKGLASQISELLGLSAKWDAYQKLILRLLKTEKRVQIFTELSKYLPEIKL